MSMGEFHSPDSSEIRIQFKKGDTWYEFIVSPRDAKPIRVDSLVYQFESLTAMAQSYVEICDGLNQVNNAENGG